MSERETYYPIRVPGPPGHPLPRTNDRASTNMPPKPFTMNQATMPSIPPTQQAVPPFHTGPPVSRSRPTYEISDIRNEADARERLSSFVVVRLEKADNSHEIDDSGNPMVPTWERVKQTVQTGMSKQDVAGRLKLLNRPGTSVLEKKATLPPAAQRQLEIAEERLTTKDPDPRYQYALVQFEEELKLLDQQLIHPTKAHRKDKKKSKHAKKAKIKSTYERVSITAYFKRAPKPNQNSKRMLEEAERERQRVQQMPRPSPPQRFPVQPPAAPVSSLPNQPPIRGPPVQQSAPTAPTNRELPKLVVQASDPESSKRGEGVESPSRSGEGKQIKPPPQDKEETGERNRTPSIPIPPRSDKFPRVQFDSPRTSRSSLSSEASWSTDQSEVMTPQSSVGSGSHLSKPERGRALTRPQHEVHERPQADSSRQSSRERPYYIIETQTSRRSPSPRRQRPSYYIPRSPRTRQYYVPGRYEDAEELAFRRRTNPPPRIIQVPRGIRRVTPPEAREQILSDSMERMGSRLERLRFEDEMGIERKLHQEDDYKFDKLEEDIRQRRRLRARLHGSQQSEGYEPSERSSRWSEDEAKKYMHDRASSNGETYSPQ